MGWIVEELLGLVEIGYEVRQLEGISMLKNLQRGGQLPVENVARKRAKIATFKGCKRPTKASLLWPIGRPIP